MIDPRELACGDALPTGPVSAWPKSRHDEMMRAHGKQAKPAPRVKPNVQTMAKGLARTAAQAFVNGRVSAAVRKERYDTCKSCPFFIEESKRCSECGCFMEAKSWIGGDPDKLCPKQKWPR